MRLRCRLTRHRDRAVPYTLQNSIVQEDSPGVCDVCIPKRFLSGTATVHDLATFLAKDLRATTPHGVEGGIFGIFVDGFAVPGGELVASAVVRENDEIELRWIEACRARQLAALPALPALPAAMSPTRHALERELLIAKDNASALCESQSGISLLAEERTRCIQDLERQLKSSVDATAAGSRREAAFSALIEERDQRIQALESQVAKFARQLAKASEVPDEIVDRSDTPNPVAPKTVTSWRWRRPKVGEDLLSTLTPGTVVRYRVDLVDPWRPARTKRSPLREASVRGRLEGDNETLLLQHVDGAMDCVEVSRLSELEIRVVQAKS